MSNTDNEPQIKADAFLQEVATVCKKHGLSISHEASSGAFLIEKYSKQNIKWLMSAWVTWPLTQRGKKKHIILKKTILEE